MGWYRQFIEDRTPDLMRWFTGPPNNKRCKVCGQFVARGTLRKHMEPHFQAIRKADQELSRGRQPRNADPRDVLN